MSKKDNLNDVEREIAEYKKKNDVLISNIYLELLENKIICEKKDGKVHIQNRI